MSQERDFYTPLPEANTDRIRTTLKLPYHLEDKIGLDLHSIEKLCQIAGITDIRIFQDTGRIQPQITGITSQGVALGSAARTSVDRFSVNNKLDDHELDVPCGLWSHLEIGMREPEAIALLESQKKDIKDPKNWADLLNRGIKQGIISSGAETLVKRNTIRVLFSALYIGLAAGDIVAKDYEGLFTFLALIETLDKASAIKIFGPERNGQRARWSLAFNGGPEFDRMIVLLLQTSVSTLAKKI